MFFPLRGPGDTVEDAGMQGGWGTRCLLFYTKLPPHRHAESGRQATAKGKRRDERPTKSWQQSLARCHNWHTVGPLYTEDRGKTKVSRQEKSNELGDCLTSWPVVPWVYHIYKPYLGSVHRICGISQTL